jgi:hypothetical protein
MTVVCLADMCVYVAFVGGDSVNVGGCQPSICRRRRGQRWCVSTGYFVGSNDIGVGRRQLGSRRRRRR